MAGTATVTGGALGATAPASQSWSTTLNGVDKQLVDGADASFSVQDVTGSGGGWTVTATATQFTGAAGTGTRWLPPARWSMRQCHRRDHRRDPGQQLRAHDHLRRADRYRLTLPANITPNGRALVNLYEAAVNTGMGTTGRCLAGPSGGLVGEHARVGHGRHLQLGYHPRGRYRAVGVALPAESSRPASWPELSGHALRNARRYRPPAPSLYYDESLTNTECIHRWGGRGSMRYPARPGGHRRRGNLAAGRAAWPSPWCWLWPAPR